MPTVEASKTGDDKSVRALVNITFVTYFIVVTCFINVAVRNLSQGMSKSLEHL